MFIRTLDLVVWPLQNDKIISKYLELNKNQCKYRCYELHSAIERNQYGFESKQKRELSSKYLRGWKEINMILKEW